MRYLLVFLAVLCVLAGASATLAGPVKDSLAYQGRLTDASDNPVPDGLRDLILSFWSDSVGGTMLHSEIHGVDVKNGLYSTCIGCDNDSLFNIFTNASIYLEVQLAGQPPMTPRTPIRYAPKAMMSARVRGDISTSPDHLVVGDLDGDGMLDLVSTADLSEMTVARKRPGKVKYSNITLRAFADSTVDTRDCDDDDDGVPESAYSQRLTPTTASLAINSKGTSAKRLRAGGDCDDTDASFYLDCDDDSDGLAETSVSQSSSSDGSSVTLESKGGGGGGGGGLMGPRMSTNLTTSRTTQNSSFGQSIDLDNDGTTETSMTSTVERKSGSIIYLDREGNEVLRSMMGVDSTRSVIIVDHDSDDDGIPEDEIVSAIVPGVAAHAINTKGTGAQGGRSVSIKSTTDQFSAVHACDIDDDGDGLSDAEISSTVTPTSSSVAIKTKGTGADANRTSITQSTDTSHVELALSGISTGGSYKLFSVTGQPTPVGEQVKSRMEVGDLGNPADVSIEQSCDTSGAVVALHGKKGYDYYQSSSSLGARMIIRTDAADTTIDIDGDGRIGIGKPADAVKRIDVDGGAYCDGSSWVNASDANSKENFEPVDGQELLEKIGDLEITKWNYKNDPEAEHIGPTAQDFREAFGVGSDGKSISTIDPSGIALAAIKELSKQNQELRSQNSSLQKQLDELKQMVERLAAKE